MEIFSKQDLNKTNPICSFAVTNELRIEASFYKLDFDSLLIKYGSISNYNSNRISFPYHYLTMQTSNNEVEWELTEDNGSKKKFTTKNGSIWYLPPNDIQTLKSDDFHEFVSIMINHEKLIELSKINKDRNISFQKIFNINDTHLENMLNLLLSEIQTNNQNGISFIDHLVSLISIHFVSNYSTEVTELVQNVDGITSDNFIKIENYISDNLSENINIEKLANLIGTDKYNLIKRFKTSVNQTPYQFILQKKLKYGKNMLSNPKYTISEIAFMLNFSDQSHFTKAFKKMYALTPKEFKEHAAMQ